jgi:hypothetical protein
MVTLAWTDDESAKAKPEAEGEGGATCEGALRCCLCGADFSQSQVRGGVGGASGVFCMMTKNAVPFGSVCIVCDPEGHSWCFLCVRARRLTTRVLTGCVAGGRLSG